MGMFTGSNPYRRVSALRVHRVAAGLSLARLGQKIGRPTVYVHRLEIGGSARIDDATAARISEVLNVPVETLFFRENGEGLRTLPFRTAGKRPRWGE